MTADIKPHDEPCARIPLKCPTSKMGMHEAVRILSLYHEELKIYILSLCQILSDNVLLKKLVAETVRVRHNSRTCSGCSTLKKVRLDETIICLYQPNNLVAMDAAKHLVALTKLRN
jgi:hypothetical protein